MYISAPTRVRYWVVYCFVFLPNQNLALQVANGPAQSGTNISRTTKQTGKLWQSSATDPGLGLMVRSGSRFSDLDPKIIVVLSISVKKDYSLVFFLSPIFEGTGHFDYYQGCGSGSEIFSAPGSRSGKNILGRIRDPQLWQQDDLIFREIAKC